MTFFFNEYFFQFSPNDGTSESYQGPSVIPAHHLSEIRLSIPEVIKVLEDIDVNKAHGPDNIPGRLLKETAPEIASPVCRLVNLSLSLGKFPDQWKLANVCPVYKSDDSSLSKNYRPISLLCVVFKCLERCVFNHCYTLISPQLYHLQHGFLRGRSTVTQLLQVYHEAIEALAKGKEIDIAYLDFAKAFDKVPHCALLNKLSRFGISGQLINWFQSYLSDRYQQVALQGTYSDWLQVLSGLLQGSILGPLLFLVYIDDIPKCIKHDSKVAIFADDSMLFKIIEKPSDKLALQQDRTQLSIWSDTWKMCLSIPKCKNLNISRKKIPTKREYHLNGSHWQQLAKLKTWTLLSPILSNGLNMDSKQIERLALFVGSVEISMILTSRTFILLNCSTRTRVRL